MGLWGGAGAMGVGWGCRMGLGLWGGAGAGAFLMGSCGSCRTSSSEHIFPDCSHTSTSNMERKYRKHFNSSCGAS